MGKIHLQMDTLHNAGRVIWALVVGRSVTPDLNGKLLDSPYLVFVFLSVFVLKQEGSLESEMYSQPL